MVIYSQKKSISDTGLENISTVEFEGHTYK